MTIPQQILEICKQLEANSEEITRRNILREAKKRGIKERSVQPADYCNNTKTGDWSPHNFLVWIADGEYALLKSHDINQIGSL